MKKLLLLVLAFALLFSVAHAEFPLVEEPTTLKIFCRTPATYPDQDNSKVTCMI